MMIGSWMDLAGAPVAAVGQETAVLQIVILAIFAAVFVSPLIVWPIGALVNRGRARTASTDTRLPRMARWLAAEVCLLSLLFTVALPLAFGRPDEWEAGPPLALRAILVVPWIILFLTIAVVIFAVLAWRDHYWGRWGRWHYTLIAAGEAVFVGGLWHWKLLRFVLV